MIQCDLFGSTLLCYLLQVWSFLNCSELYKFLQVQSLHWNFLCHVISSLWFGESGISGFLNADNKTYFQMEKKNLCVFHKSLTCKWRFKLKHVLIYKKENDVFYYLMFSQCYSAFIFDLNNNTTCKIFRYLIL